MTTNLMTLAVIATGCGAISTSGGSLNELAPTNVPAIAQGSFTTTYSGKTVTGVVTVYNIGNGQYTVHLDGFSCPSESGLQLLVVDSTTTYTLGLQSDSGNQNYTVNDNNSPTFFQVRIYSPALTQNYGIATLTSTP